MNGSGMGPASAAQGHVAAAMLMLKMGKVVPAQQRLRQAVASEPDNAQWHLELARVLRPDSAEQALASYAAAERLGLRNAALEAAALEKADTLDHVAPETLWSPERLDIGAKLHFARLYLGLPLPADVDAGDLYRRHILKRTAAREPDASGKSSIGDYETSFAVLIESIRDHGFHEYAAVPVDGAGRILNGAHRVAAAIALGLKSIPVVRLPAPWKALDWGMGWFLGQGFTPEQINLLLHGWAMAHPRTARILLIEHAHDAVPAGLMEDVRTHFPVVAWRALHPMAPPQHADSGFLPDPAHPGALRYVLVEADETALHSFCERHDAGRDGRLRCRALPAEDNGKWFGLLFDERRLEALHAGRIDAHARPQWLRYAGQATQTAVDVPEAGTGFVKWRNLTLLDDVHTVIDVGVAYGTPDLYRALKPRHVVLIEPVPLFEAPVEALRQQFPSSQYLPIGLSSKNEDAVINYREDAPILTSLLKSSPLRDTGSERIVNIPVQLRRLDTVFDDIQCTDRPILLKMDTEGYELEILRGAVRCLPRIKYVMLELSVITRFEGSYSCSELVAFLQQQGFVLHTCLSASVDAQGYCRVVDAVFRNCRFDTQAAD
ncbi:MAG TPA: hypothetical protein DDZ67_07365 [Xanthomonadaceae bacterium]|nr:hypothetical protein [Xanthomonadaceae bacterium]